MLILMRLVLMVGCSRRILGFRRLSGRVLVLIWRSVVRRIGLIRLIVVRIRLKVRVLFIRILMRRLVLLVLRMS